MKERKPQSGVIKKAYVRFLKIRGTPREIGWGFALGLFIGFSPTMGFQMLLGAFLASLLKWSKIAAVIGVQITNVVTAPFIYGGTYFLGSKILGIEKPLRLTKDMGIEELISILRQAPEMLVAMSLGGFIMGIPTAVIGYLVAFKAVGKYQNELKEKIRLKANTLKQKVKVRRTIRNKKSGANIRKNL